MYMLYMFMVMKQSIYGNRCYYSHWPTSVGDVLLKFRYLLTSVGGNFYPVSLVALGNSKCLPTL